MQSTVTFKPAHLLTAIALTLCSQLGWADDIIVGTVNPLTGAFADLGNDLVNGARAYFEATNAHGGVNGNRLHLQVRDGGIKAEGAAAITRDLIAKEKPLALLAISGTAINEEILRQKILTEQGIPLVGPMSGGNALRNPVNPYLYNVRASYRAETRELVRAALTGGAQRIAVLYQSDDFGEDGVAAVEAQLAKKQLKLVAKGGYPTGTDQVKAAVDSIRAVQPDAVILFAANKPAAAFIKALREAGSPALFYSVSTVNPKALIAGAGLANVQSMVISQVVPSVNNTSKSIVKEYRDNLKRYVPAAQPSPLSLESYIAAKMLVEGLKRAGSNPTRQSLQSALDGIGRFDAGGFPMVFGPHDRQGSDYVDVGIVGPDGELRL